MPLKFDCVAECSGGDGMNSAFTGSSSVSERKLSVEFLEDEADVFHHVDDWDGKRYIQDFFFLLLVHVFTSGMHPLHSLSWIHDVYMRMKISGSIFSLPY